MNKMINGRSEEIPLPSVLAEAKTAADWQFQRREEILRFFEDNFFGRIPPRPENIRYEIKREVPCFEGLGIRKDVTMHFMNNGVSYQTQALWYIPSTASAEKPASLIVGLNFCGNAGCTDEPDVEAAPGVIRSSSIQRWQIRFLLSKGFSLITSPHDQYFLDDVEEGIKDSIYKLYLPEKELVKENRQYTAISAWSWAYSRMLELGETDIRIDRRHIWAHGHSRLGKTSLWTGANDSRFAGIVANDSGCCGAALSRDKHPEGEHYQNILHFYWWFQKAFDKYVGHDDEQDFDMHFLCALTAPRPLLISSATEDLWADPFNEYRTAKALSPVYRLYGLQGLPENAHFPEPDTMISGENVAYYLRSGTHDVLGTDWDFTLQFIRNCEQQGR